MKIHFSSHNRKKTEKVRFFLRISKNLNFLIFSSSQQFLAQYYAYFQNYRGNVLLDYVCIGFLELFCLKYRCNQIVFVMKAKKSENTTYPSSKVKLHRATKQFEGRWNSSGKDPMQSKSGPSLHHLIWKPNYSQTDATLLYCFNMVFPFFLSFFILFSLFSWISIPERKVIRNSLHTLSYQILNTNTIIEWKNYLISKIYHLTGCVRLRVHVGKRHSTPDEKRRGNTWTTVYH